MVDFNIDPTEGEEVVTPDTEVKETDETEEELAEESEAEDKANEADADAPSEA